MSTTTTTRRAILAGIAAVPAVSLPALATEPDPIYAAIETHIAAYESWARALEVSSRLPDDDPRFDAADRVTDDAGDAFTEAGLALASSRPATIAGVLALLDYIERFNHRGWSYPTGKSGQHLWPYMEGHDDPTIGAPVVLAFPYRVMNNVRAALAMIGGAA